MDIGRQRHGAAPGQRRGLDIDGVMRQFRPDAGIERDLVCGIGHRGAPVEKL
jgi:hypothetical protein